MATTACDLVELIMILLVIYIEQDGWLVFPYNIYSNTVTITIVPEQSKILHMKSSLNVSVIFYTSEEDCIMPLSLKCFKSREDDINTFEDNVIYMVNRKGANILSAIACHWV